MNPVILKRMLAAATQSIVKKTVLDMADVELACDALAKLITESAGVSCQIKLVMNRQALDAAIAAADAKEVQP